MRGIGNLGVQSPGHAERGDLSLPGGGVILWGVACPQCCQAAPGPTRSPGRRTGRRSGRTRPPRRAGRARRGRRPSPGCTRPDACPSGPRPGRGYLQRSWAAPDRCKRRTPPAGGGHPPATSRPDLLGVLGVAGDEAVGGRVGRQAREHGHGQVERSPPRVDGGGPASVWRAERGQRQRRLGGHREVVPNLAGVVARMVVVFVERHAPWNLLRYRVDPHLAGYLGHRREHLAGHLCHRPVRGQRHPLHGAAVMLDHRLVNP